MDTLASEVATPEAALCPGRCDLAWQALAKLRVCESGSHRLAARKRVERETSQLQASALSEFLLQRWRAGDWAVSPDELLRQLSLSDASILGEQNT